jgi:hypothetical protein
MKRALPVCFLLLAACSAAPRWSSDPASANFAAPASFSAEAGPAWQEEAEAERHGVVHTILLYIPNRIFDILDMVRLRLRVGPGFAFDARATEVADLFIGAYTSFFVGIPGPRGEPEINWPFGIESLAGIEASVADASTGAGTGPGYGAFEFGVGAQFVLLGFDVGIDPWEIVDFVLGIVTIDPVHDDL